MVKKYNVKGFAFIGRAFGELFFYFKDQESI